MWQIRQMIALAVLAICAYTDIKERNIYIFPLCISSAGAVMITIISYIFSQDGGKGRILFEELVLPMAVGVLLIVAAKTKAAHVGMGDAYLLAALGLIIGIRPDIITAAAALTMVAVYALYMMISGRRRRFMRIPFAPFVMTGFMMVLINEI